jgi:hypothetical protein
VLQEGLGHDSEMDFLEALFSSDAVLDQIAHLLQNEDGHGGDPFHVPFCVAFLAFFVSVWFLAFVFLVVAILTTTSDLGHEGIKPGDPRRLTHLTPIDGTQ